MGDLFIFINSYVLLTVGEFKDDCLQKHIHQVKYLAGTNFYGCNTSNQLSSGSVSSSFYYASNVNNNMRAETILEGRYDSVTRSKSKGVKFIIKVL